MGVGQFSVAAATAVVGYDLAKDTLWKQQSAPRFLTGFALKGSAAGADTKVRLMVDTVEIGQFFNIDTGVPSMDHLIPLNGNYVPPGALIHILVEDAPATNPINGIVTWA